MSSVGTQLPTFGFLRSIRFQLTVFYVASLAALLVVFSASIYEANERMSGADQDTRARALLSVLLSSADASSGRVDLTPALATPALVVVLDTQGGILQQQGQVSERLRRDLLARPSGSADSVVVDDQGLDRVFVADIERDARRVATLAVGMPPGDVRSLPRLRNVLMIGIPIALLVAAGLGYWLSVHALGRVRAITRTARAIGETDLSRRLRLSGGDEMGELARTFDAMLDRLQAAFQRQRQFTADAGHQLRTPVTIIGLEVQRALAQPRTPDAYTGALQTIGTEAEHMRRLVSDLLTLARADSGEPLARASAFDLTDVVLEVVERFVPIASQHGISLDLEESPSAVLCHGDRDQVGLLISNLVDNAIKYTTNVVRIATTVDGLSRAVVRVEDNGPGIAPDDLAHVFERFYRVPGDAHTGHGLGLAIARSIARAHGGDVTAQSTHGRGSVFELRLPLRSA